MLRRLARVEEKVYAESSTHFVIRSRNADLSVLLADEAEAALQRICQDLLDGQDYAHPVDIYVWADAADYAANAPASAPEWSGGCFSLTAGEFETTRRIDLTQLDADGRFSTVMLDRTLPHEMCHLVLTEFLGDASCPLALHEGLAMLAEAEPDNRKLLLAGKALATDGKIPLDGLLLAERGDLAESELFYAEALSFFEFLHGRLSRAEFKAFLVHVRNGATVIEALQQALYLPKDETFTASLAAAWQAHAVADAQFLHAADQ
jgi:hypothetical protein